MRETSLVCSNIYCLNSLKQKFKKTPKSNVLFCAGSEAFIFRVCARNRNVWLDKEVLSIIYHLNHTEYSILTSWTHQSLMWDESISVKNFKSVDCYSSYFGLFSIWKLSLVFNTIVAQWHKLEYSISMGFPLRQIVLILQESYQERIVLVRACDTFVWSFMMIACLN